MQKTPDHIHELIDQVTKSNDGYPIAALPSVRLQNSIPDIMDSVMQFQATNVSGLLMQEVGQTFLKHQVHSTLGVTLVHRHFDLAQHEMLVNIGNVALPCATHQVASALTANPSSWCFSKEGLMPYEFTHRSAHVSVDDYHMQGFLADCLAILEKHRANHILGLCTLDGVPAESDAPSLEFSSGRANITLPFDVHASEGGAADAMWQIEQGMFEIRQNYRPVSLFRWADLFAGKGPRLVAFAQCKARCKTGPNTGH